MNSTQQAICDELVEKYYHDNETQLDKKVAKKNNLTRTGLRNAIASGVDDLTRCEPDALSYSSFKFKRQLEWYIRRATYYYLNEPLTYRVVRSFSNLKLPYEDKLSAVRVGFINALNKFNPDRGIQFSTYAYRVMQNEVIAANNKYKRSTTIKEKARKIYATNDGIITNITPSRDAHKVIFKGEKVQLVDVKITAENRSTTVYHYLYNLSKKVVIGAKIKQGNLLGTTAGVENAIGSTDEILTNEHTKNTRFSNPFNYEEDDPAKQLEDEHMHDVLQAAIKALSKKEQLVITRKYLDLDHANRQQIAKELNCKRYEVATIEKSALAKLKLAFTKQDINSLK